MKKLMNYLLFTMLITFSFNTFAGFEGLQSGTSLKIFNRINCSSGLTCTRTKGGVFKMVSVPSGGLLTDGNILVGNSSGISTSVNPTGDVDISNTGVFSIASGVIVNGDVNSSAAIDYSKLATLTDGNLLIGNGSNCTVKLAVTKVGTKTFVRLEGIRVDTHVPYEGGGEKEEDNRTDGVPF